MDKTGRFIIIDLDESPNVRPGEKLLAAALRVLPRESVDLHAGRRTGRNEWQWDDPGKFSDLLAELVSGVSEIFEGTVCIVIPDDLATAVRNWLYDPVYDAIAIGQHVLLSTAGATLIPQDQSAPLSSIVNVLLHAWKRVSLRDGRTLICCKASSEKQTDCSSFFSPDKNIRLIDEINFSNLNHLDAYVRTLLTRAAYSVSPTLSDKAQGRMLSAHNSVSDKWGDYSLQPKSAEYSDLLRQELGSRSHSRSFLATCCKAFHIRTDDKPFTLLPTEIQVALGSLRLARRLANCTLEGDSFCCTLALFADDDFSAIGNGTSAFNPIIDIEPDVPFTFPFLGQIRKHAEAAQGEGLFLLVNASKGLLTSIACHSRLHSPNGNRRHSFMSALVSRSGMLVHIRDQGFVEVYAGGVMPLWHDGFEWRPYPYSKLLSAARAHFYSPFSERGVPLQPDDDLHTPAQMEASLVDAVRRLLDRRASSIIVLLDPRDEKLFEEVAYEQLRNELLWAKKVAKVHIDALDADALAGLLALDGAHVVGRDGRLVHISRRIDAPKPRYEVEIQPDDFGDDTWPKRKKLERCFEAAQDIRAWIKYEQRFSEFAIREYGDNRFALQIFNFIDEAKWKSVEGIQCFAPLRDKLLKSIRDDQVLAIVASEDGEHCQAIKNRLEGFECGWSLMPEIPTQTSAGTQHFMLPVFSEGAPLKVSDAGIEGVTLLTNVIQGLNGTELTYCYAVRAEATEDFESAATKNQVDHVAVCRDKDTQAQWWYVHWDAIKRAAQTRDGEIPAEIQRKLRVILRSRSEEPHAGTGTRAANEASRVLPNSTVIKVSASGDLKLMRNR